MFDYFLQENNPFSTFSREHGIVLFIFFLITSIIIFIARKYLAPKQQNYLGTFLASLTLVVMLGKMFILYLLGEFTVKEELPLYICRIVTFFVPFMMYYRNRKLFGVLYFWILAGTLNALITPDLVFGLPHYSAWIYWILHAGLVGVILYAVFVYRLKPNFKDLIYAVIIANIYLGFLHIVNYLLDANYSYTMHKPPGPSLLDTLGPWPWYLVSGQLLALLLFLLLYLPFFIQSRRRKVLVD
jgi:hypothetical integral membrane protein (TIGR02206 family)